MAIEANSRAFLKCLCIKEIFKLDRAEFKLGDFVSFLRSEKSKYDLVFASGVLYHMENPVDLLKLMSKVSDRIFLWTHYYDEKILSQNQSLSHKFLPVQKENFEGIALEYSIQSYKNALEWSGFCGGPKTISKWLTRDSILKLLRYLG